jgi:CspA family cold shock protein
VRNGIQDTGAGPAQIEAPDALMSYGVDRERSPFHIFEHYYAPAWIEDVRMPTGRVKFFNSDRGYGFIEADGGGSDVFVHISAVEAAGMDILMPGQLLTYDVGTARDGRSKAINLRLLNPDGHRVGH